MLASRLSRPQIRSPRKLDLIFFALLISLYICPSDAHIIPVYVTRPWLRKEAHAIEVPGRKGENFPKDFATAVGVAVVVVTIGTTLICVFAHFWRQILDWGRGKGNNRSVAKKSRRKDEEAWFCGPDRGLPMPQFDNLEPESEPLALSMQDLEHHWNLEELYGPYTPTRDTRNATPGARTRSKALWNNSGATLPSWLDPEEIERPTSIAYVLDRA
ncbi:hypothetical protein CHU98_g7436 [Xylaria longipes]|nr:hypothetical protein CHU98_g7436 [Xylaria longipes]